MARFVNSDTGVVVLVSDEKAERFGPEWERDTPAPAKKAPAKRAPKPDKE